MTPQTFNSMAETRTLKFILKLTVFYNYYEVVREEWTSCPYIPTANESSRRTPDHTDILGRFTSSQAATGFFLQINEKISKELFKQCESVATYAKNKVIGHSVVYKENDLVNLSGFYSDEQ